MNTEQVFSLPIDGQLYEADGIMEHRRVRFGPNGVTYPGIGQPFIGTSLPGDLDREQASILSKGVGLHFATAAEAIPLGAQITDALEGRIAFLGNPAESSDPALPSELTVAGGGESLDGQILVYDADSGAYLSESGDPQGPDGNSKIAFNPGIGEWELFNTGGRAVALLGNGNPAIPNGGYSTTEVGRDNGVTGPILVTISDDTPVPGSPALGRPTRGDKAIGETTEGAGGPGDVVRVVYY